MTLVVEVFFCQKFDLFLSELTFADEIKLLFLQTSYRLVVSVSNHAIVDLQALIRNDFSLAPRYLHCSLM